MAPRTLEIEGFDWNRLSDTGMSALSDIAVDRRNDTVYFMGRGTDEMASQFAAIRRYLPTSDALTTVVDDYGHDEFTCGVVDGAGRIVAVAMGSPGELVRIDPGTGGIESFGDADVGIPGDVDLDATDDYVAMGGDWSPPYPLSEIDASDGTVSTVDGDLATTFPDGSDYGWKAVAVDPSTDDVYVAPRMPGLGVIGRGTSSGADVMLSFDHFGYMGQIEDMHFVDVVPEPGTLLQSVAALFCLGCLARRRRGVR